MAYPQEVDKFIEKLNKLDKNTYVIEEEVQLIDGIYEGELQHDNVSLPSINVYTGSKLTGSKIENVIVSTPSLAPWKKDVKIFSNKSPVYITYETTGDTVEADDINKVQSSIINTQTELDRYKSTNNNRVSDDEAKLDAVENNKAEKTYVDTELLKKADKTDTYTKEETDQRIQNVVGAAPSALDTLKEIADSLGDDKDFAGTMTKSLSLKVDKVDGKQLSTEDYTTTEKNKLAGIEECANNYIHPATHPASMITEDENHRFTNDTDKANLKDVNSKKHIHINLNLLEILTQDLIDGWNSAVSHITDKVKHITSDERMLWNTVSSKADSNDVYSKTDSDNKFTTKTELNNAGYGDMLKSIYDKDDDGVVDVSEKLIIQDTRNVKTSPGDYSKELSIKFKTSSVVGLSGGTYCTIIGFRGWSDDSGDAAREIGFQSDGIIKVRTGTTTSGWGAWEMLKGSVTWNDLRGV